MSLFARRSHFPGIASRPGGCSSPNSDPLLARLLRSSTLARTMSPNLMEFTTFWLDRLQVPLRDPATGTLARFPVTLAYSRSPRPDPQNQLKG